MTTIAKPTVAVYEDNTGTLYVYDAQANQHCEVPCEDGQAIADIIAVLQDDHDNWTVDWHLGCPTDWHGPAQHDPERPLLLATAGTDGDGEVAIVLYPFLAERAGDRYFGYQII